MEKLQTKVHSMAGYELEEQIKQVDSKSDLANEEATLTQLRKLLTTLNESLPSHTVKEWQRCLKYESELVPLMVEARKEMKKMYGFELELRESVIPDGGRGVFLSKESEVVSQGQLVGLYPGTVYLPFEPILFQSLGNPFIFRCADGWMIDGNKGSISNWIYKSCAYRDLIGPYLSCDLSWLTCSPINPLSVGQLVNNHSHDYEQNVEYVEVSIPTNFPLELKRFLPNVFYSNSIMDNQPRELRIVTLMSTRTIHPDQELYSSYFTVVTADNS